MLTQDDILKVVGNIPRCVMDLLQNNKIYLAGGFIRSVLADEEIKDIDLFTESELKSAELCTDLAAVISGSGKIETENAFTVVDTIMPDIQFIHRWTFNNPYDLIASFDFTIAQAAIWWENGEWRSVTSESFYDDLYHKQLVYTLPDRVEAAGGSLIRVRKFLKRGYDISAYDFAKVIARMMKGVDLKAFERETELEQAAHIAEVLHDAYGEPVDKD